MKLKVLLVKPFMRVDEITPPLGFGYLAGTIRKNHDVEIVDCIRLKLPVPKFKEYLKGKHFDVIGIQSYSFDLAQVEQLSKVCKELLPDCTIFIGGPQPTLDAAATMNYLNHVEYGFDGEAELGFPELLQYIAEKNTDVNKLKSIPGLIYRNDGKILINPRGLVKDLDTLDPSWDLLHIKEYPLAPHGAFYKQKPVMPMILTRGCPFRCKFCGAPGISGKLPRSHSPQWAVDQIEHLVHKYGIREIHIEDDNLTYSKQFTIDFCTLLIERNLGITWTCPNGMRLDTLTDELVALMKRSGLYAVSVAIESGSNETLKNMHKDLAVETVIEKVALLRKHNLEVIGFFIVGYPGETKEDIEKTIDFACSLDLKRATFSAFKPFPGTPAYDELVAKGEMQPVTDWSTFSLNAIAWTPKGISDKELKNLRRKGFLRFYGRPAIMWKMMKEINNLENFYYIAKRVVRWMT